MTEKRPSNWRDRLSGLGGELFDELDRRVSKLGLIDTGDPSYEIVPYRGYGTASRVLVHGRVIECRSISAASEKDSLMRNILNTWKRVDSDPLRHARVRARIGRHELELQADDEGYFREWVTLPAPLDDGKTWVDCDLELIAPLREGATGGTAKAQLRLPAGAPAFGVISDLDDTVIQSRITSFFQAVRTVMLGNARTRLPFPGVAAFYQALEGGSDGKQANPIFYVSSSPWNIYDLISDFMDFQRIPAGPIHLRDWDVSLDALSSGRLKDHKAPIIKGIMDTYPSLPFILIGDDSQHDPEIYRAILDEYPGRIPAIYIRNVRATPERSASVQALAKEVLAAGCTLILADDTYAAAKHAAEQGWIAEASLESIREEKRADEGVSGEKADVPGVPEEKPAPTVVVE